MDQRYFPLIKPRITDDVKSRVMAVLDSGYLTEGQVTKDLEKRFCAFVGSEFAVATTSCTTGIEIALRALGVGPGDEVIVPDYTYPATAACVAIVGGKIVIVDVDPQTMLIDYDAIENAITPTTKAIIPVSLFGNPLDYDRLSAIKSKHDLYIIEDSACSIGAAFDDIPVGKLADISVFSMHPRKFITTGEGGMVTTDNPMWYQWMNSYKHFGVGAGNSRLSTLFEGIGTNYKLSDVLAAIGVSQMVEIEHLLSRRIEVADNYTRLLKHADRVKLPEVTPKGKHAYQTYCLRIKDRDRVMETLRRNGVEAQIGTYALHMQPAFAQTKQCRIEGEMKGSEAAFNHSLALPLYHDLTYDDQVYIIKQLIQALEKDH